MPECRIRLQAIGSNLPQDKWEGDTVLGIGRLNSLEVVLDESSISRRHAEITLTDQGWVARDLGSTNGTYLNGVRLGRTGKPIQDRDLLQCGNVVLAVEMLSDDPLDLVETPCGNIQVQAAMRQSPEEVAHLLAMDVTRSTKPGEQLLHLLRAGQFYDWTNSVDEILSRNLQEIVGSLGAKRGAVVLIDAKTGKMNLRAVYPVVSESQRPFSQTLARRCFRTGQSLLCADVITDPEMLQADSVTGAVMSSIICALLRSPRKFLGILHLDRGPNDAPFTRDELCRADALAANMSLALESAQQLQERQQAMFIQTVTVFSQVIELRDPYTGGHAQRVTDYALLLAEKMRLSESDCNLLRIGAPLHDIGKIGIDDQLLRKNGPLTQAEFELMKSHTVKGAILIKSLPGLEAVLPIVRNHHERWDGAGYPDQLAGEKIPRLARLMAVVDTFDAMTTNRPYRAGMSVKKAMAQIEMCSGTQFDPECVQAFLQLQSVVEQQLELKEMAPETLGDMSSLFKEYTLATAGCSPHHKQSIERRPDTQMACTAATVLSATA